MKILGLDTATTTASIALLEDDRVLATATRNTHRRTADVLIAVDEACALLLPHASPAAVLSAHFELSSGRLLVETGVATEDTAQPDREGFAWTVLGALTSSVDVRQQNGVLTIALTKSREAAGR